MSSASIDAVLADFRAWLEAGAEPPSERIDTAAIVAQFTALRHEVNLQTKASRAIAERAGKAIEGPSPMVKLLLDLADVLSLSMKQMQKVPEIVGPDIDEVENTRLYDPPPRDRFGWFDRLLGRERVANDVYRSWSEIVDATENTRSMYFSEIGEKLRGIADSAADGYAMSLRRIEAALPELGLVPIPCHGLPFDPHTMEVVEMGGDGASGTVTEELRRGYHCNGAVLRYALVRVAS